MTSGFRKGLIFIYLLLLFECIVGQTTESNVEEKNEDENTSDASEIKSDEKNLEPKSSENENSENAKEEINLDNDEIPVESSSEGAGSIPKEKEETEDKEGEEKEKEDEEKEDEEKEDEEKDIGDKENENEMTERKEETTKENEPEIENKTVPTTKEEGSIEEAPPNTFAVWNSKGEICILAKFQSSIAIVLGKNAGKEEVLIPSESHVKGECASADKSPNMQFLWGNFIFSLSFDKISDDLWGITSAELSFDTSDPIFDGAENRGKVTAKSKELQLFETPFGKSLYCPGQEIIHLYNNDKEIATVRLKEIHLQPYDVEDGKFSTRHRCTHVVISGEEEPFVQDETIPLAVGCTLALITLFILVGFSVHRAYNAAKVDYNSMEP